METLASPKFEGRLTGSPGEKLAADYLIAELKTMGARPLPGMTDFRMPFTFTAGSKDGGSKLTVAKPGADGWNFAGPANIQALSFSDTGEASGAVVFAGYGLVVPDTQNFGYDSYAGLDVKDKIVVVLRYFPEDADQKTRGILARYADLRYKAQAARQRGAKGMIVVTGPRSPNAGERGADDVRHGDRRLGHWSRPASAATRRRRFSRRPASSSRRCRRSSIAAIRTSPDSRFPDCTVTLNANVDPPAADRPQRGRRTCRRRRATTGVSKPWVSVGAHYDHLGRGGAGNSLADKQDANEIHHGADDNASGTATVLAIGEALSKQPRKRNLLLAFWSGEELGLLGSNAFVTKPPVPIDQIAAYLNFDMVGRVSDNKLTVQATGTSAMWPKLLEQANVAAGFDLTLQEDPYQPTDVSSFNSVERAVR